MQKSIQPEINVEKLKELNVHDRILNQKDLINVLPFGKTKIQQLLNSGQLPVVKIGKDYVTTYAILEDWLREHIGSEIYF